MANFDVSRLTDELSAPLGDIIASVGRGVAEAQQALDARTLEHFRQIYGGDDAVLEALRQIGYRPTWYQIPEATAEIKVALTVEGRASPRPPVPAPALQAPAVGLGVPALRPLRRTQTYAVPVDAGYANRFDYNMEAASKLTFRIVPVPPSTAAAELRLVPELLGLTRAQLEEAVADAGLDYRIEGAEPAEPEKDPVTRQSPERGEVLPEDGVVMVSFEPA